MAGSSHAIALTSATCSGGKTARATRARLVLQTLKTLLGEPSSPPADQSRRGIKPPGDLRVRHPVRSVEHDPSALHILKRKLLRASATLELRALLIAELDPVTTWTRHRHITSRDGTQLLHQSYDRYLRMRLLAICDRKHNCADRRTLSLPLYVAANAAFPDGGWTD